MIEENFSLINTFLKVVQNSAILLLKVIFLFQNKCVFLTNGPSQTIIFYERIIQKGKKKRKICVSFDSTNTNSTKRNVRDKI